MDISPLAVTTVLIQDIPNILTVLVLAIFHLSAASDLQDVVTQVVIALIRPILGSPTSLRKSQEQTKRELPIRGPVWVSKAKIPRPLDEYNTVDDSEPKPGVCGVREALIKAIQFLGDRQETFILPTVEDVEAEWNAYRPNASWLAARPKGSEKDQYDGMMTDVEPSAPTILYFHGGAFCLGDPSTHRLFTTYLSNRSASPVFSIRFRLAPQHPFPAPLLDCLISYLALISPPPGSFHDAIQPSQIIIAGDSSGAAHAASLNLLLLTLPRLGISHLRFHNRIVPVCPPAALTLLHPYLDITRCLPSIRRNAIYDILTPPALPPNNPTPAFPADDIWPTTPPRVETYCNANAVTHPLISPLAATQEMLVGTPPTYLVLGSEAMEDEISVFARRLFQAGVQVHFDGYLGAMHCFGFLMPWTRMARRFWSEWASFCREIGNRREEGLQRQWIGGSRRQHTTTPGTKGRELQVTLRRWRRVEYGTWTDRRGVTRRVLLATLALQEGMGRLKCDDQTVRRLMSEQRDLRIRLEQDMLQRWKNGSM